MDWIQLCNGKKITDPFVHVRGANQLPLRTPSAVIVSTFVQSAVKTLLNLLAHCRRSRGRGAAFV
jgi:hypothetical protein